ncbi:uncharacterized protein LOC110995862 isoform X2 [Pieris rapae]|uniref:uncharacterized protein LOC110995862 isoform X2 n=1 Tax=Pieris rapae TaxID=64459 RepID=UPI001E27C3C8|nr:uncharacterized protein LOC110995862 isoform X2 [Pieris rapae]
MSQKERIKKALGISVYPWSSDEESNSDEPAAQATVQSVEQAVTTDQAGTGAVSPNENPISAASADARTDPENLRRLRNIYWKMLNLPSHMLGSQQINRRDLAEMRRLGPNTPISSIERVIAINRVSDWNRLRRGLASPSTSRMTRRGARRVMLAGTSQQATSMERDRPERPASAPGEGYQNQSSTLEANENEAAPAEGQAAAPSPQSEEVQSDNEEESDDGQRRSPDPNPEPVGAGTGAEPSANAGAAETVENESRQANDEENEDNNASNNSDDEQRRRRKRRRIVTHETAIALKKFNEKFLRVLECPVCLECMAPPLRQCGRGHLLCSRCCSRLNSCPLCRTGLSSVRNRAMEAVAELLKYPCRHGCGQERRLKHREAHEANCSSRIYKCPAASCTEGSSMTLGDLPRHLQMRHPAMVKRSPRHTMRVPMNQEHRENMVLMVGPELFHLRLDVEQRRGLHVHVAYLGPVTRAKYFAYEVSVDGDEMRKLVYTRVTHSDLECSSVILRRVDCFHLPLAQAPNYLRSQPGNSEANAGHLELTVQILVNEQRSTNLNEPGS